MSFRPHVWGFFFHNIIMNMNTMVIAGVFVPMFGDSFFTHYHGRSKSRKKRRVFVPMFGDSFFTLIIKNISIALHIVFVPMFGDSFFTLVAGYYTQDKSLSFRPHVWGFFFHFPEYAENG